MEEQHTQAWAELTAAVFEARLIQARTQLELPLEFVLGRSGQWVLLTLAGQTYLLQGLVGGALRIGLLTPGNVGAAEWLAGELYPADVWGETERLLWEVSAAARQFATLAAVDVWREARGALRYLVAQFSRVPPQARDSAKQALKLLEVGFDTWVLGYGAADFRAAFARVQGVPSLRAGQPIRRLRAALVAWERMQVAAPAPKLPGEIDVTA